MYDCAVIAYNAASTDTDENFDGVHLDNEPYLLPVWNTDSRETIIQDFLALNEACQTKCTLGNIVYGIDIPFWFDAEDPETGEAVGIVTYDGERKSLDKF